MTLRILIAGLLIGVAAFAADTGAELFQKARTEETAAGNLEEAIKLYQRVATEFASDRALAAKALVAEARCYEKLGQDKALKLYEQVAHDYKDQREPAATANARLAALRQGEHAAAPTTMAQRKIELPDSSPDLDAPFRTDGQRAVYKDSATGALMMSDLAGRGKRLIFKPKEGVVDIFGASRDFSLVYMSSTRSDMTRTFAVIRTDGSGLREFAVRPIPIEGYRISPEFSWDNRSVLLCQRGTDGSAELVRVSIADGEIHKVREADGSDYRFSPDGRFISYLSNGKVFVIPSQGGEPKLVSDLGGPYDWTRDGRYLIFTDVSGAAKALYLLPMKDGQRAGDPVFIRYSDVVYGRTSASGAFIYSATPAAGQFTPWLGKLDPANGFLEWEKLSLAGSNTRDRKPTWSPDSTQIAYAAQNAAAGQNTFFLRLRNITTGEERELYNSPTRPFCFWSTQHPSILCTQDTSQNTEEALSISTDTGRSELLGTAPALDGFPLFLARDDRAIYAKSRTGLRRWEIGTSQWTTVYAGPNPNLTGASPDERWISRYVMGAVEIRPMAGGDWRPLVSIGNMPGLMDTPFTRDGDWFVYRERDAGGRVGLYRVSTSGGQPERLGDFPSAADVGFIQISPDGKKILAQTPTPQELWMLENFEPKQQAAK